MNGAEKKTSPWVYVGLGCLGVVLLAVAAVALVGYLGYRKVKQFEADMKDPAARTAKVQQALGADRLPDGYHAVMAMSIPFVMDMAMLSDVPPDAQGQSKGPGQRGFIYMATIANKNGRNEVRDYFEGRGDPPEALRRQGINIERGEVLKRGTLDVAGQHLMYVAQRGHMNMGGSAQNGITTTMLVECPGSDRQRMAFWFGPAPAVDPNEKSATLNLAGTPADESALQDFMGHFRLCGR